MLLGVWLIFNKRRLIHLLRFDFQITSGGKDLGFNFWLGWRLKFYTHTHTHTQTYKVVGE
jgi:hypothetical protein